MERPLYLEDFTLKEFDATVVKVDKKFIIMDNTAFYPSSGGQPHDTGIITKDNEEYKVVYAGKFDGDISHEVDKEGLKEGDKIHCIIDWDRRYKMMRMHTAMHVITAILHKESGALITGNQIDADRTRVDFSLENFNREEIQKYVDSANKSLSEGIDVKHYFLPTEEALKMEGMIKLAKALPPETKELHVVEIGNVDKQADGGTHVANTREVGTLELLEIKNKGKNNRRLYFALKL